MSEKVLPSHDDIIATFKALPDNELLTYAHQVQKRLLAGEKLDIIKESDDPDSWVTVADTWIQERILEHFERSPLAGLYAVIAEESLAITTIPDHAPYTLVIDPLDGTSPFRKGSSEWGIMVALYVSVPTSSIRTRDTNQNAFKCYSWNLLSDGSLYTSYLPPSSPPPAAIDACHTFRIDHCAYGAEDLEFLALALSQTLGIPKSVVAIYSNPTAVVVGHQLLMGKIDALLWVASERGKRTYPVYDLTFLEALPDNQFVVRLAVAQEGVTLAVVARTAMIADALIRTAEVLPWARLGMNQPDTLESAVLSLRNCRVKRLLLSS